MTFVSEKELYCFMLRGYHLFSERISPQWIQQINAVIDEMNACGFGESYYPNFMMQPMYGKDGTLIQIVVRNILEVDPIFRDLLDLDFVLPWIVTLLNRSPRLTENGDFHRKPLSRGVSRHEHQKAAAHSVFLL